MLKFHNRISVHFSPGVYMGLCVMLLLLPIEWVLSWLIAAMIHELFHCIAIWVLRIRIISIGIRLNGARITTEPLSAWKECLTALAGPMSGILLIFVAHWLPRLAVCAFFQTAFNLLPIREFDGGRIIYCVLKPLFGNNTASRICAAIEYVSLLLTLSIGIYLWLCYKTSALIPLVTIVLIIRRFKAKTPCKPGKQIVQYIQPNIRGR